MVIVCDWCKKVQGEKEPLEDTNFTGGICNICAASLMSVLWPKEPVTVQEVENLRNIIANPPRA